MDKAIQQSIFEAIKVVTESELKKVGYTMTRTGVLKSIDGYNFTVEMMGEDFDCRPLYHLIGNLKVGDVVLIQQPSNDASARYIVSRLS